mmetsp:Transcript_8487/g.31411  ORF Transcript_8487/g.31411 Transcript_8487/m.31411 type:complete len:235 (-) Transcript_8487:2653-3357(-)
MHSLDWERYLIPTISIHLLRNTTSMQTTRRMERSARGAMVTRRTMMPPRLWPQTSKRSESRATMASPQRILMPQRSKSTLPHKTQIHIHPHSSHTRNRFQFSKQRPCSSKSLRCTTSSFWLEKLVQEKPHRFLNLSQNGITMKTESSSHSRVEWLLFLFRSVSLKRWTPSLATELVTRSDSKSDTAKRIQRCSSLQMVCCSERHRWTPYSQTGIGLFWMRLTREHSTLIFCLVL